MKVITVSPNGAGGHTVEELNVDTVDIPWLQGKVGGYVTPILVGDGYHVYGNDDGKLMGQPVNRVATMALTKLGWIGGQFGDFTVGPIVFIGFDYENTDKGRDAYTSVPEAVANAIRDAADLEATR